MEGGNHFPFDVENQYLPLVTSMAEVLSSLRPLSANWCIYRVPNRLRRVNEIAYTPQVVSIGPLHHGSEALRAMEEHKWRYLRHFIRKTHVSLQDYIAVVKQRENRVRDCYADIMAFSSDEFVKLILLDAVFVIEIMRRFLFEDFRDEIDPIFTGPWITRHVVPDLRLLENQIPFFIIEDIYGRAKMGSSSMVCPELQLSIRELCHQFWIDHLLNGKKTDELRGISFPEFKHFVDLLRQLCIPLALELQKEEEVVVCGGFTIPTMTELHQAGVRLKEGSQKNMLRFYDGILEIPKLVINNRTEAVLRNVIAYEQCHCVEFRMTNWIHVTRLVDTPKDLELLVKHGIVDQAMGNSTEVLRRIKKLAQEVVMESTDFYFAKLCEDMNNYCRLSRNRWKANLKQRYFNTPWTTISVIGATLLLLLSFIQTVCSIRSLS